MIYTSEVQHMCPVAKGAYHGPAPIPEEGKWVQAKEICDISGFTHGIGWCAPQQGACKLTLNVKNGVIEEALVETIGCSGMTHSAAMASEILIGKTILEALNTDLVCDAINTAMRELFLQIVYGRTQSAFSEGGLPVGASLEDLGKGLRSQVGTMFATKEKGPRYLEMAEGYVTRVALNKDDEIVGYEFISLGKMMDFIKKGDDANTAWKRPRATMASSIAPPSISTRDRNKEEDEIMALFESYERRINKISGVLAQYGIGSVEECREICKAKGFDPYEIVKGIQPICFENACWAYTVGAAIALKAGVKTAAEAAKMIGVGLQSFCIDGSVADDRKVGLGHGNLGAMLLATRPSASPSWPATSPSPPPRAPSASSEKRQQGPQGAPARHPQRSGQGRRPDHQPHQRLHLCADPVRLLHRRAEDRPGDPLFRGRARQRPLLRR